MDDVSRKDALSSRCAGVRTSFRLSHGRWSPLRMSGEEPGASEPLYPTPTEYKSPEDAAPNESGDQMTLQDAEVDLERGARSFWRAAWLSWWIQLACALVGGVILLFALAFPGLGPKTGASAAGLLTTSVAAVLGFSGLFISFGYTRLGLRMERQLDAIRMYGKVFVDRKTVKIVKESTVRNSIRLGVTLACIGLLAGLVGLQSTTGIILAKVLSQGFSGPYYQRSADPSGTLGAVQPIDLFVIQAAANIMLSLFTLLVCSLWLSTRYQKHQT